MSFAPPKVEEKETNITKPIIPSLKLDEIKDEEDLDQEGKIEGKTNVQQEENNITEKTQQESSSKIDETLNENDTIITAKDTESPIKKTSFHMPNQTARKKTKMNCSMMVVSSNIHNIGIAHLLEHLLFRGTKSRPNEQDIKYIFDKSAKSLKPFLRFTLEFFLLILSFL